MFEFSEEFVRQIISALFRGKITTNKLPVGLYHAIAETLKKGIYKGYGVNYSSLSKRIAEGAAGKFTTGDLELLGELRTNTYLFSGAKTYQQVRVMSSYLVGDNGVTTPFKQFEEKARDTFDLFNKTWLRTEYDTAIGQAQSARNWQRIKEEASVLPLLQYDAVIDEGTSDICRSMNGIVAPVKDAIWKRYGPLNHFNCRCVLRQLSEGKVSTDKQKSEAAKAIGEKMDDLFKMNPGESGYIFSKKHPYYRVAAKDKAAAKNNFGLPIPKSDG